MFMGNRREIDLRTESTETRQKNGQISVTLSAISCQCLPLGWSEGNRRVERLCQASGAVEVRPLFSWTLSPFLTTSKLGISGTRFVVKNLSHLYPTRLTQPTYILGKKKTHVQPLLSLLYHHLYQAMLGDS